MKADKDQSQTEIIVTPMTAYIFFHTIFLIRKQLVKAHGQWSVVSHGYSDYERKVISCQWAMATRQNDFVEVYDILEFFLTNCKERMA